MTSFQKVAHGLRADIRRTFSVAPLAASALVSGAMLLGPQAAHAADTVQLPVTSGTTISSGLYSIEIVDPPTAISQGDISISSAPGTVDFDFLFPTDLIEGGEAGSMKYFISSNAGNFLTAEIGALCPNLNPTDKCGVTKTFTDANLNDLFFADGTSELTFTQTGFDAPPLVMKNFAAGSQVSEMYVFMTYYGNGSGAQLTEIRDTYQTPGPLPVLGAGAAFGFSRKLRSRIKASRLG